MFRELSDRAVNNLQLSETMQFLKKQLGTVDEEEEVTGVGHVCIDMKMAFHLWSVRFLLRSIR